MPMTPNSASTPYASPADFIEYIDANLIGDLLRDDGTRATPTEILADPRVVKHLMRASGWFEAICLRGGRYTAADLQALTGASREYARWIVSAKAFLTLAGRRAIAMPVAQEMQKELDGVEEDLTEGEEIFAFVETEAAGLAAHRPITPEDLRDLTPTLASNMTRMFGQRRNRRYYTP
jgi:hypothetical protein